MVSKNEGMTYYQQPLWKSYLYQLQTEAPKALPIFCLEKVEETPPQYGLEYHDLLHRKKCSELLKNDGNYLVRRSELSDQHSTLSLRFNCRVKHYKLYYDGQHYVGEKKFSDLNDLISDGLVTLYLESKASKILHQLSSVNYRQSPYFTLNRSVRKALNKNKSHLRNPLAAADQSSNCNNLSRTPDVSIVKESGDTCIPIDQLNIRLETCNESHNIESCTEDPNGQTRSSNESLNRSDSEDLVSERPHRFQNHSFTGLHWCGFCGNFLWGLMLQGVKCQDCGFKAHRPCSLKVPNDCCPDLKNLTCSCCGGIFGMDLSTSMQNCASKDSTSSLDNLNVPSIVTECIAEIETRGLTVEGLYRVPGSHEQIDSLRLSFERDGKNVSLDEKCVPDINVIAGLLKLYFRLLPLRLVTAQCFQKLTEANKMSAPEGRLSAVKEALRILPVSHYETLKTIVFHLARVCDHSAINKMTATSLSTIFGPTLVHTGADADLLQPEDLLALKLSAQEPRVVEMLIVLHKEIF